jgi:peptidoglycan/LPS O-acetylase OafA/YrhL
VVRGEEIADCFHPRIEALRGIACLIVATCHSIIAIEPTSTYHANLNRVGMFIFSGSGAVFLFFVLSGYVLELALRRIRTSFSQKTVWFAVRHSLRIYPAALVVTCIGGLYLTICYPSRDMPLASQWYSKWYPNDLSWNQFFGSALLLNYDVNHVVWTLQVELLCSALMPLIHLGNSRISGMWRGAVLVALIAVAWCDIGPAPLRFLYMFYLGTLIPDAIPVVFNVLWKSRSARIGVIILATTGWLAANPDWYYPIDQGRLIYALAAFVIVGITAAATERTRTLRLLDVKVIRFYGRISYSFYLLHFLCLYVIARLLMFNFPQLRNSSFAAMFALWTISVAAATVLGALCYYSVERPFIQLGKRMGEKEHVSQTNH